MGCKNKWSVVLYPVSSLFVFWECEIFLEDRLTHLDFQIPFGTKKGSTRGQQERLEGCSMSWR